MKRFYCYIVLFLAVSPSLFSQSRFNQFLKPSDSLNVLRRNTVVITEAALATTTIIGLNQLWYADYPRSNFKTINDSREWLQMDKLGHVFSSYQLGSVGARTLNWAGVSKKDQKRGDFLGQIWQLMF